MENNDKVIVGSGRAGDFVHQHQKMASAEGFRNVSGLWFNQTQSYDDGLAEMEKEIAAREDINTTLHDSVIGINDAGKVAIGFDGRTFVPTMHALLQLSTWLDVPHTLVKWYLQNRFKPNGEEKVVRDTKDTEIVVMALRNGLRRVEDGRKMLFRTYQDGTLRAVLSDIYLIIDNRWYIEQLRDLIPAGRMSHWRGDADTIYGNVLIPDTIRAESDSDYGGMVSIGNCEIGKRKLEQYPSVFRAICMNGCIWDMTKGNVINKVHRGKLDLAELRERLAANVHRQIPLLQSGVDKFLALRSRAIPTETRLSKLFACVAKENGFSREQLQAMPTTFTEHESENRNAFGLVNTITRIGQLYSNESWFNFDALAGELMTMSDNQWSGLINRADNMEDETAEKLYGLAV